MSKAFAFANLVAPTGTPYPSLDAAVQAGQALTAASHATVRALPKAARREWFKQSSSAWPCISLTEGVNPALRISGDNPPALLHGFAADYDNVGKQFTTSELSELAHRCVYPPTAAGASLSGDGVHAIWLFKEPIPVLGDADYARRVMAKCYSNLRVGNFVQGFDEAFKKPDRLLSIDPHNFGWLTDLREAQVVDEVSTRMWAASALVGFKFDGPVLDLEKVYENVQRLFPGRWQGSFNIGARGPRFWDSSSTDPSAAVVTEAGMVYFSDGGGFKPWSAILGTDTASKLSAESLAEITNMWAYDLTNKDYVLHDKTSDEYSLKNRTQLFDRLELSGIERDLDKKRAVVYIEDHRKVTAVVSLANQKRGIIKQGPHTYLNSTDTKPIKLEAGDCTFTRGLIEVMFPGEQQDYFLGWLHHSVVSMLSLEPSYSQAVFLAGDVSSGKSLLQYRVLTPLFGGKFADPIPHLIGESGFNSELAASGHWLVSDAEGPKNLAQRASFTQKIKAIAANPGLSVHAKYATPVTLFLNSRITFSFNKTDEALGVVPRLGADVLDKLCLFNVASHAFFDGMDKRRIEGLISAELSAFAYWLVNDYTVPEHVRSFGRYPTKSYHAIDIMNHAHACQASSELLGWIDMLFTSNDHMKDYGDRPADFTAAVWLKLITDTAGHGFGLTPNKLSAHFQQLAKQYPLAIQARLDKSKKVYSFSIDHKKLSEVAHA